jgi:hypothetical protein
MDVDGAYGDFFLPLKPSQCLQRFSGDHARPVFGVHRGF